MSSIPVRLIISAWLFLCGGNIFADAGDEEIIIGAERVGFPVVKSAGGLAMGLWTDVAENWKMSALVSYDELRGNVLTLEILNRTPRERVFFVTSPLTGYAIDLSTKEVAVPVKRGAVDTWTGGMRRRSTNFKTIAADESFKIQVSLDEIYDLKPGTTYEISVFKWLSQKPITTAEKEKHSISTEKISFSAKAKAQ